VATSDLLKSFPTQRLQPVDGMAVTAEVWGEAHDYHRHQMRLHALLGHGSGIVTGLEVIASDPPDNGVFILPGMAVDAAGNTIVLPQPLSFDVGRAEGLFHILLSYGEGRPQPRSTSTEDGTVYYIQSQFAVEASAKLPETPGVELARIRRQGRGAPIQNAQDSPHPAPNQIDLRYRNVIGAAAPASATIAVCYADKAPSEHHGRGAGQLARFLRSPFGGQQRVWADDDVPLTQDLDGYNLVYLVAHSAFRLEVDEMNRLYMYLWRGGTVFIESCRREAEGLASPPDGAFADMLGSLGITLEPLPAAHRLLSEQTLFGSLPAGYETSAAPGLQIGGGVILSTNDYGCLWQGERRGGPAQREEIRSALEWGANLLAYATAQRRERAPAQPHPA
jgi:hypothetical protein